LGRERSDSVEAALAQHALGIGRAPDRSAPLLEESRTISVTRDRRSTTRRWRAIARGWRRCAPSWTKPND